MNGTIWTGLQDLCLISRSLRNTFLTRCSNLPVMQPGKRSFLAFCQSDSLIQLPSWLLAPSAGMGIVSLWFLVTITVLLSTRATSLGSVRANQLETRASTPSSVKGLDHKRSQLSYVATYQFSYLGSLLTIPSTSRPARMEAVSSAVPVTTCTLEGLHSSTAPFTKSATVGGSEGTDARERRPTPAPILPCLSGKTTSSSFTSFMFVHKRSASASQVLNSGGRQYQKCLES